jgi:hypothetical protein
MVLQNVGILPHHYTVRTQKTAAIILLVLKGGGGGSLFQKSRDAHLCAFVQSAM